VIERAPRFRRSEACAFSLSTVRMALRRVGEKYSAGNRISFGSRPPEWLWDAPAVVRLAWLERHDPTMAAAIRHLVSDTAAYEMWLQ
jgi:hypothetical protein